MVDVVNGPDGVVIVIGYTCPTEDGDKLITPHGSKQVVDDAEMPMIHGTRVVDLCLSLSGLLTKQTLGIII